MNEDFASDDEYEPSYDELRHELRVDDEGLIGGDVDNSYVYVFVCTDNKGNITEGVANGKNLSRNKKLGCDLFTRLAYLFDVGYVIDDNFSPSKRSKSGFVKNIELSHPSRRGVQLHLDGSLREAQWNSYSTFQYEETLDGWIKETGRNTWEKVEEGPLYIAPEDYRTFNQFIHSIRNQKIKKPKFWKF